MTNIVIHPEVGDDIAEAVNWYKGIDPDLAVRLRDVVYGSIERAKESPWHHPKIHLELPPGVVRALPIQSDF